MSQSIMTKIRSWRLWFLIFCVGYIGWIIFLGQNDFYKVNRSYKRAFYDLNIAKIEKDARQELTRKCLKKLPKTDRHEGLCVQHSSQLIQSKIQSLTERRHKNMSQASTKRTMFYISFGVFFIIFPLVILYATIMIIEKLVTSVKIVK